jgi:uncharacterized protein (TIGR03000 family)
MFKATWFSVKVAALATAVILTFAGDGAAQRGVRGGGWGGGGSNGGGWGGSGWGGRGYGGGWDGGYGGYGGYGMGQSGWGYNTAPYYGNSSYYAPLNSNTTSGYQSFYPPDAGSGQTNDNTAIIQVRVQSDAKLTFNGKETSQTGSQRYFATPPLEPGKTFTYEVEATWQDANGKQVRRTREVTVQANQPAMVNFTDNQSQGQNQNSDLNQNRNADLKRDQDQKPIQNRDIPR